MGELRALVLHDVVPVPVGVHRVSAAHLRVCDAHVAVRAEPRGEALRDRVGAASCQLAWSVRGRCVARESDVGGELTACVPCYPGVACDVLQRHPGGGLNVKHTSDECFQRYIMSYPSQIKDSGERAYKASFRKSLSKVRR